MTSSSQSPAAGTDMWRQQFLILIIMNEFGNRIVHKTEHKKSDIYLSTSNCKNVHCMPPLLLYIFKLPHPRATQGVDKSILNGYLLFKPFCTILIFIVFLRHDLWVRAQSCSSERLPNMRVMWFLKYWAGGNIVLVSPFRSLALISIYAPLIHYTKYHIKYI